MNNNKILWLILIERNKIIVCLLDQGELFLGKEKEWSGDDDEELLAAVAASRGDCLFSSGKKSGPSETIFVLPPSWTDNQGEILPTYKKRLKLVSQRLSLTPLGFLVKEEVLSRWGKKKESFSQPEFFHYLAKIVSEEKEEGEEEKKEQVFGFTEGDIADVLPVEEKGKSKPLLPVEKELSPAPVKAKKRKFHFQKLVSLFKSKLVSVSLPRFSIKPRKIIFFLPLVLLGGCFSSWYFAKTTIKVYLTPETVTAEIKVRLDPNAESINVGQGVIPVELLALPLDGEKTASTTGEKLIGERAKGKVTIYNRTAKPELFESGTILGGPGGLKFITDNQVKVASKTADLVSGVDRWGEVEAEVTAAKIGAEYNLARDSVFTLAEFSKDDFLAKNKEQFIGGTSRQIRAVSETDRSNLRKVLLAELSSSAKEKFQTQSGDGRILIESLRVQIIDEDYDAAVGDEKDDLTLNLKTKIKVSKLSTARLTELAQKIFREKIAEGFSLNPETITTELKAGAVDEKGVVPGELALEGKAYPFFDKDKVAHKLVKKREEDAKKLIHSYPRVYRCQFHYSPSFAKIFPFLPPRAENIKIEIEN